MYSNRACRWEKVEAKRRTRFAWVENRKRSLIRESIKERMGTRPASRLGKEGGEGEGEGEGGAREGEGEGEGRWEMGDGGE